MFRWDGTKEVSAPLPPGSITMESWDDDTATQVSGFYLESSGEIVARWRYVALDSINGSRYYRQFGGSHFIWLDHDTGRWVISTTRNSYAGHYWTSPVNRSVYGDYSPNLASGATDSITITRNGLTILYFDQTSYAPAKVGDQMALNTDALAAIMAALFVDGNLYKLQVNEDGSVNAVTTGLGSGETPLTTPIDQDYGGENALQYVDPDGNPVEGGKVLVFTRDSYLRSVDPVPPDSWAVGNTTTITDGQWADQIWLGNGEYVVQMSLSGLYAPAIAHITVGDPPPTTPPETTSGNDWLV